MEELKPLVDAMRELPRDERAKAVQEFKALNALGANLLELEDQCVKQPGRVMWTLMQTYDNGRRGFQLFLMNHETGEYVGEYINAHTLQELALALVGMLDQDACTKSLRKGKAGTCNHCQRPSDTDPCEHCGRGVADVV
jgi:hypothetical protein